MALSKRRPLEALELFLKNNIESNVDCLKYHAQANNAGTCMFDSRVVLDTHGKFHVCEKVNNKFPLGDITNGFDYSQMVKVAQNFVDLIEKNCMACDIQFFCERCYATFANDGTFQIPSGFCEQNRETIINDLERFIQMKEEGLV
jgi:uncharacterized protein